MRTLLMALALMTAGTAALANQPKETAKNFMTGDYVEARTASVFAGACHYNGELTTAGREAILVWNVKEGQWEGVSLKGVTFAVAVVSDKNLAEPGRKKAILYLDPKTTDDQQEVIEHALRSSCQKGAFGCLYMVKRTPLSFARKGNTFQFEAKGVSKLVVDAMPDNACCKMPQNVWYKPLIEISDRKVGYTRLSRVSDKTLGPAWSKMGENTAFYGTFTM